MDYEKLAEAKKKFDVGYRFGGYASDDLRVAIAGIFEALTPPAVDASIDRATDGRITEYANLQEAKDRFEKKVVTLAGSSYRIRLILNTLHDIFDALIPPVDISIDRVTDGRITEEPIDYGAYMNFTSLPAAVLADGCAPDPADDGPEVEILRKRNA